MLTITMMLLELMRDTDGKLSYASCEYVQVECTMATEINNLSITNMAIISQCNPKEVMLMT